MGDPNLSADAQRPHRSLAALIGAGDPDALAGFRDAHVDQVRSYCAKVCASERVEEACEAAFTDFFARVRTAEDRDDRLEELLLAATRSAAAGRFEVRPTLTAGDRSELGVGRDCAAMPELLAALANRELQGDEESLREHLAGCRTCTTTADRMRQAEREFAAARAVNF